MGLERSEQHADLLVVGVVGFGLGLSAHQHQTSFVSSFQAHQDSPEANPKLRSGAGREEVPPRKLSSNSTTA